MKKRFKYHFTHCIQPSAQADYFKLSNYSPALEVLGYYHSSAIADWRSTPEFEPPATTSVVLSSLMRDLKGTVNRLNESSRIWTIGHSTRTAEEFVEILREHQIEALVDVRSFPGSRRYPHFSKGELSETLTSAGIQYLHLPQLGGRRKPRPTSKNIAWQNEGFRGYADYMETADFQKGIETLLELGGGKRAAVMCAEALWWRCHRSLIADYLKVRGLEVIHIMSAGKTEFHPYTSAARIIDGRLSYEGLLG